MTSDDFFKIRYEYFILVPDFFNEKFYKGYLSQKINLNFRCRFGPVYSVQ